MKNLIPAVLVGLLALAIHQRADSSAQAPSKATAAEEVAAVTYEHLATAIIEIERESSSMCGPRAAALLVVTAGLCSCRPAAPSQGPVSGSSRLVDVTPREIRVDTNPNFLDVAPRAGLTAVLHGGGERKDHLLESVGTGAAFIDFDEAGRLDVFLVNAWALDEEPSRVRLKGRNVLYRNMGHGTFVDVTERAQVADGSWGCGVCAGDYDNDGHVDLYVTNFGPNRLYRNRGDGTFEQVAEKAGVAGRGWSAGASFFDADGDGDLDLYVACYVEATMDEVLAARRVAPTSGARKPG